uniref:Uncharacterized protein n=1 Tax=Clytia hemisphaerica TaxID=252671 RepID=A0A7M5VAV5_9CNID|eukprot:TCONS_00035838-protein
MAAGGNKASFAWLNKMGVTNCYSTARNKHKTLAENHDQKITEWKKRVEEAVSIKDVKEGPDLSRNNVDGTVAPHHQSIGNPNKSFHWFHTMAVERRVLQSDDFRKPEEYKQMKNTSNVMITNYTILFARVLVDFLPAFKKFSKVVRRHIKHPFADQMRQKSDMGSQPQNNHQRELKRIL